MRARWLGLAAPFVVACGAFTTDEAKVGVGADAGGASSSSSSSSSSGGSSGVPDGGGEGGALAPLPSCMGDIPGLTQEIADDFDGTALDPAWRSPAAFSGGMAEVGGGLLTVQHGGDRGHLVERPLTTVAAQRVAVRVRLDVTKAREGTVVLRLLFTTGGTTSELRLARGASPSSLELSSVVGGGKVWVAGLTSPPGAPIILRFDATKANGQVAFGVDTAVGIFDVTGISGGALSVQLGASTDTAVIGNPLDTARFDAIRVCTGS